MGRIYNAVDRAMLATIGPYIGAAYLKLGGQRAFDTTVVGTGGMLGNWARRYIDRTYYSLPEEEKRRWQREKLWAAKPGHHWHNTAHDVRSEAAYYEFRRPLTDALAALEMRDVCCEVGTGNGRYLHHLVSRVNAARFVGIDLNTAQIEENKKALPSIEWYAGELRDWLAVQPALERPLFVFVGTFIYFTQKEMEETLWLLKKSYPRSAIGVLDTVSSTCDLSRGSVPRGAVMYSHNYREALLNAGYRVAFEQEIKKSSKPKKDVVLVGV